MVRPECFLTRISGANRNQVLSNGGILGCWVFFYDSVGMGFHLAQNMQNMRSTNISVSIQELLSLSVQRVYACDVQN
ncbi:hypothetical protein EUGRSUZ_C03948 [Eucalyptus grandis]|uniref:Uncharacterized protein n=2 Tax=Eucalyptus grandis TaxID=71139 RepID=A0ACC3LIV7_EUCGR|nr:hypothetical protein EUGRSUZ_C03948 [Eucalyptus grandis]